MKERLLKYVGKGLALGVTVILMMIAVTMVFVGIFMFMGFSIINVVLGMICIIFSMVCGVTSIGVYEDFIKNDEGFKFFKEK